MKHYRRIIVALLVVAATANAESAGNLRTGRWSSTRQTEVRQGSSSTSEVAVDCLLTLTVTCEGAQTGTPCSTGTISQADGDRGVRLYWTVENTADEPMNALVFTHTANSTLSHQTYDESQNMQVKNPMKPTKTFKIEEIVQLDVMGKGPAFFAGLVVGQSSEGSLCANTAMTDLFEVVELS